MNGSDVRLILAYELRVRLCFVDCVVNVEHRLNSRALNLLDHGHSLGQARDDIGLARRQRLEQQCHAAGFGAWRGTGQLISENIDTLFWTETAVRRPLLG